LRGVCRRHAGELEHLGDVTLVGLAQRLLVRVEVVAPVRQTQTALLGVGKVDAGILEIGQDFHAEQRVLADGGRLAQVIGDRGTIAQRIDRGQPRFEGFETLCVDARFVHAGGPQVGDDLLEPVGGRQARRVLGDLSLHVEGTLSQDV
jgi:hypothetical protein